MAAHDRSARLRVNLFLHQQGPVEESTGKATALLMDTVRYTGTFTAFVQLIAAMERADEITREVRGKRTYKISASSSLRFDDPAPHRIDPLGATDIRGRDAREQVDYDELGHAVLRQIGLLVGSIADPPGPGERIPDEFHEPQTTYGGLMTNEEVSGMTVELNAVIDRELPAGRGAE